MRKQRKKIIKKKKFYKVQSKELPGIQYDVSKIRNSGRGWDIKLYVAVESFKDSGQNNGVLKFSSV